MIGYNEISIAMGVATGPFFVGILHQFFKKVIGGIDDATVSMIFYALAFLFFM